MVTLGILSDTHVPDRVRGLKPAVISIFREERVNAILHAGDISQSGVLAQLREIAPVYAVRGNRDWPQLKMLPTTLLLEFEDVKVGLTHSHGGLGVYLLDKMRSLVPGAQSERYLRRALSAFPQAKIVVFGHTHIPLQRWVNGKLCINPGSAACPDNKAPAPSIGLLRIGPLGSVNAEIRYFE